MSDIRDTAHDIGEGIGDLIQAPIDAVEGFFDSIFD